MEQRSKTPKGSPSEEHVPTAVLLSGGAPTMHFIAGAMHTFYSHGLKIDVIATSGAGALPGLLYAAPKSDNPLEALRSTVDLNIEALIYEHLPMNFKVFQKAGPVSETMWNWTRNVPPLTGSGDRDKSESLSRLYQDWIQLLGAMATPSTLNWRSKAMCARIESFLDDIVDWGKLPHYHGEFCLNTFNLDRDRLEVLGKHQISASSFFAALAMCWLYPPTLYNNHKYTEGASHDPSAIEALWNNPVTQSYFKPDHASRPIERIIAVETVRPDMWREPRDLYDSLSLTIMDPLVTLSEQMLSLYARLEFEVNHAAKHRGGTIKLPKLYIVPFSLPSWAEPRALDWNRSTGQLLWHTGADSARDVCRALGLSSAEKQPNRYENPFDKKDEDRDKSSLEYFRYHKHFRSKEAEKRRGNFLSMFNELFELALPSSKQTDG